MPDLLFEETIDPDKYLTYQELLAEFDEALMKLEILQPTLDNIAE